MTCLAWSVTLSSWRSLPPHPFALGCFRVLTRLAHAPIAGVQMDEPNKLLLYVLPVLCLIWQCYSRRRVLGCSLQPSLWTSNRTFGTHPKLLVLPYLWHSRVALDPCMTKLASSSLWILAVVIQDSAQAGERPRLPDLEGHERDLHAQRVAGSAYQNHRYGRSPSFRPFSPFVAALSPNRASLC